MPAPRPTPRSDGDAPPPLAAAYRDRPAPGQRSIAARVAAETKRYLGLAAYLLVIFGTLILFSLNVYARADRDVQHYPRHHFYAIGLINALVLAKFMLIAEAAKLGSFAIGRRLDRGPLAYAILYRALLFTVVLVAAYVLEEVVLGAWRGRSPRDVLPELAGGPRGLASFAWVMFVALVPYFAYRALGRALGADRLRALLFGKGRGEGLGEGRGERFGEGESG